MYTITWITIGNALVTITTPSASAASYLYHSLLQAPDVRKARLWQRGMLLA